MNIEKYKTAAEWYRTMKKEGYEVSLALYHSLNKLISEHNITFTQAYEELFKQGKIEIDGKNIKFFLNEKEKFKET